MIPTHPGINIDESGLLTIKASHLISKTAFTITARFLKGPQIKTSRLNIEIYELGKGQIYYFPKEVYNASTLVNKPPDFVTDIEDVDLKVSNKD